MPGDPQETGGMLQANGHSAIDDIVARQPIEPVRSLKTDINTEYAAATLSVQRQLCRKCYAAASRVRT
jgi:hypothetical protein